MALGPVELLVVRFPGNRFTGNIAPALQQLVDTGTIRVIDLVFATKDADGNVAIVEMNDLEDDEYGALDPIVDEIDGMIAETDIHTIAESLEPNSSGAMMLFENTWAAQFVNAIADAGGEVVLAERIPRAVIESLEAAHHAEV